MRAPFVYETGNKIQLDEQGYLKNLGNKEQEAQVSEGQVSYINPDGQTISLAYTADENGYRPTGDHLPTPPPIPEEILKALEQIRNAPVRTRPPGQTEDDGQYYPEPEEIAAREQYFRNQ
ncbi:hypothetical protein B566_EDAN014194 [Ephemera danica]|nr:hypothetical protein B566_EDAN014194 [Ephemera danica]